jgi:hypothetical protein
MRTALAQITDWLSGFSEETPRDADPPMGRLLSRIPRPLIDPRNRLLLIFSPKSACSNVVVWFFHHLGHAQAARDYHPFPHRYRLEVYYSSELYRTACKADFSGYQVVRVVRDPLQRAVSAYRHLLSRPNGRLARAAGMTHIARKGLSFSDYIKFLEGLDLNNCDSHFAVQRHPIEDLVQVTDLINVSREDLYARLAAIEDRVGLQRTDLQSSDWVGRLNQRNRPQGQLHRSDINTTAFFPAQAKTGPWPQYEDFLTTDARAKLTALYAVDVQSYGVL